MNREFPYSEEIQKGITSIMALCYQINCHTPLAAFFDYSGHTDQIDIRICMGKEEPYYSENYQEKITVYLSASFSENPERQLAEVIAKLSDVLIKNRKGGENMPKTKKVEVEAEVESTKASDFFGISEERADEIIKAFRHAKVDHGGNWGKILVQVKSTIKGEGEYGFFGWVFGRMYSADEEEHSPMKLLEHILKH